LRRVGAGGEPEMVGVVAAGGELPVGAFGGGRAGGVGVGADDDGGCRRGR
jgi:hypothetical protein